MEALGAVVKALYNGKSEIILKPTKWIQRWILIQIFKVQVLLPQ